jgi:hypothetical protein
MDFLGILGAEEKLTASSRPLSFDQILARQHQWPSAVYAAHLFKQSGWWAAAQQWPQSAPGATSVPPLAVPRAENKVVFMADQALAPESLALLQRMAAAMHLAPASFAIWPNSTGQSWEDLLQAVRPKVIIALGAVAYERLTGRRERLSQIHGQWQTYAPSSGQEEGAVNLMATFHPDFLLINPAMKRPVWQDLQKVMRYLAE